MPINQKRAVVMTAHGGVDMLKKELTQASRARSGAAAESGVGVMTELLLAAFIMAVGLSLAGAATYLYQWLAKQQAILRFDGKNFAGTIGHLAMSFFCGPMIMLQMGWSSEKDGTISIGSALLSAFVAFGWSFITGLLFLGAYFAIFP